MAVDKYTPPNESFSDWYNHLVLAAELADHELARGCLVVKPYGWAHWENLQLKRCILLGNTNSNAGH